MDNNVLSCSKCGHTVNESAEACAYCGTPVSSEDSASPSEDSTQGIDAQVSEPSLLPGEESSPDLSMGDEAAGKPEATGAATDPEPIGETQPGDSLPDTVESVAGAGTDLDNQLSDFDDNIDFQLPDDELIVELDAEESVKDSEPAIGDAPESAAAGESDPGPDQPSGQADMVETEQQAAETTAEVIPLADKVADKTDSNAGPDLPDTAVLEESTDDSSESETLGADILELVQDEASEQEPAEGQAAEKLETENQPAAKKVKESSSEGTPESTDKDDGELAAILLESADGDQTTELTAPETDDVAGESEVPVELAAPADGDAIKSGESSKTDRDNADAEIIQKQADQQASVEALNIEKSSRELAEAKKKQKAGANAKAIKKKQAALAKAKALKIKKLKLAKAQALKKKKLKLAKAQALKKQKAAQAGIETASKEVAAGSDIPVVENSNRGITDMDANTKMLGLLKKYEGQSIGINYDNSASIKEAQLVEANDEFFSVFVKDKELSYNHPLKTILTIIEGQDGVETGESEQKEKFKAVVKVYPLVLF